ncbi:conserved hypothetical protein [Talaromyces stipitatus ATCC 10500]|uniref:Uncharacterized protein n=1 Tax=Talaromyces stipitatus (strain ATCC 10500 / CBS 375.48 / QM 6759 / NRRL 1006) TaxID=441959 RepID=B8MEE3_TALSN|nr:uncharacterized protein TSTA_016480 [Talaromyces stipitatus ATCC 10500]EED16570.1 conserved hypothetical protein [Talaromyces stipitatus ATCC 10500]
MSPDPLSWTLRFKKHKTTVMLMLPAQASIQSTKEKLHSALRSRGLSQINGDPIPDDASQIEFGTPIDRNDLEKGWVRIDPKVDENGDSETKKPSAGRPKKGALTDSLQAANIRDGQAIAFRFRKASEGKDSDEDEDLEDPGWDVSIPSLDDEELQ